MLKVSRIIRSFQTQPYILQHPFYQRSNHFSTLLSCTKCRNNRSINPPNWFRCSAKYHQGGDGGGSLHEMDTGQPGGGHMGIPDYHPVVPVIPIPRSPIYPKFLKLIEVSDKSLMGVLRRQWQRAQPYAGVFLRKDDLTKEVVYDLDEIHQVGTFVKISQLSGSTDKLQLTLEGHGRIKIMSVAAVEPEEGPIERFLSRNDEEEAEEAEEEDVGDDNTGDVGPEPILMANVEKYEDFPYEQTEELKSTCDEVIKTVRKIVGKNQHFNDVLQQMESLRPYVVPNHLADFGAALTVMSFATSSEPLQLQAVLEERDIPKRLEKSLELLKRELDLINLQQRYGAEAEEKVNVNQRRFMLEQQMKLIEKELGVENDSKDAESNKFRERLKLLTVPEKVNDVIEEEISKLSFLDQHSSEFNVTRSYLDWLTSIPWGLNSKEVFEISRAKEILDEDHYGLDDIKERILEFIAVGQLSGSVQGKILCFWGPPGVGKTSIGRSIARALNREYFRFSVGGMTDVAEIKGHRRTYIGAMPGKIVQCLKKTKTENPLILIDEVDKIGHGGIKGDPSAALLELLDPEQNTNFLDHYLDVPVDLSRVLFICTANSLETIPGPLRDRMELIQVSGYVDEEKLGIAENYLVPVAMKSSGVTSDMVSVNTEAVKVLIEQYCRESGVRNLQKHIEKLFRKSALRYVKEKSQLVVTPENLHEFVGNSRFNSDMMYENSPPGVTIGLAWTSMGGTTLFIETVLDEQADKKTPSLEMTGQLGDVMKESVHIAYTFAKSYLLKHMPSNDFFKTASIHLHIPEGATPKDGPSAGSTIITALLSLALNQPIPGKLAMTGEVSLTGKILPVGGIKEKVLAARRSGIQTVLLPYGNRKDYDELPDFLKGHLEVVFIRDYGDVFDIVFGGLSTSNNKAAIE